MAYEFYLGIDAEESGKVTIALVEKAAYQGEDVTTYHVRHLEQREGADERALVERIRNLIADEPYVGRTMLIVNRTAKQGRRLAESLGEEGLTPIGAVLSGGDSATETTVGLANGRGGDSAVQGGGFIISEHELVETLSELYGGGQLSMEQDSQEVSALAEGIQSYEAAAPEAGIALDRIDAQPARNAANAGLVIGTALACWYGEQHSFDPTEHLEGEPPTTGSAKRMLRPDTAT
jgi:hypothetical protein